MTEEGADRPAALRMRRLLVWLGVALLGMSAYAQFAGLSGEPLKLFVRQDRFVVLLYSLLLIGLGWYAGRPSLGQSPRPFQLGYRHVIPAFVGLALLLWAGTYLLFDNYAFTRDEHMAVFDAAILERLRLAAPVDDSWRSLVPAMEPLYRLVFPDNAQWASAYLPGNAALRAAVGAVFDPALTNPLLSGCGGILLFALGRRLFPDSTSAQATALLIYATSAQWMVNAMMPFAVTAHMTLNLLWLLLFLRGGLLGHAGAGLVGLVATGLHQIIFHPLFVLPFLEYLRRKARYRELAFYLILYALIGLFWVSYHSLIGGGVASGATGAGQSGLETFIRERVVPLLAERDPATVALMDFNLVRFVAWQNLALIPLFLCAIPVARRAEGIAQPLYFGILLTIAAMFILLPFQSIGWGYRYLHGLLGSFALLAAYGWRQVEGLQAARALVLAGTAATLLISIPYLFWTTRQFIAPSIAADRAIDRLGEHLVIIEDEDVSHARDLVRNDPFLRNRPIRLSASNLTIAQAQALCSRGTIRFVSRQHLARFGIFPDAEAASRRFPSIVASLEGRPCLRPRDQPRDGTGPSSL